MTTATTMKKIGYAASMVEEALQRRQAAERLTFQVSPIPKPKEDSSSMLYLRDCDLHEIYQALQHARESMLTCRHDLQEKESSLPCLENVTKEHFPLKNLAFVLAAWGAEWQQGSGYGILKNLAALDPVLSEHDKFLVFLGIACYVTKGICVQDPQGQLIGHVVSNCAWKTPECRRYTSHTTLEIGYHTDMGCEILALQVRGTANTGGYTYLSSAKEAVMDLKSNHPAALEALMANDWPIRTVLNIKDYYLAPLLILDGERVFCGMDPDQLGPHPDPEKPDYKIPPLTDTQLYALEELKKALKCHEHRLELNRGDIVFFDNLSLTHRRDSFTNDKDHKRYMVKLFLEAQPSLTSHSHAPWVGKFRESIGDPKPFYKWKVPEEYWDVDHSCSSAACPSGSPDEDGVPVKDGRLPFYLKEE